MHDRLEGDEEIINKFNCFLRIRVQAYRDIQSRECLHSDESVDALWHQMRAEPGLRFLARKGGIRKGGLDPPFSLWYDTPQRGGDAMVQLDLFVREELRIELAKQHLSQGFTEAQLRRAGWQEDHIQEAAMKLLSETSSGRIWGSMRA